MKPETIIEKIIRLHDMRCDIEDITKACCCDEEFVRWTLNQIKTQGSPPIMGQNSQD